MSAKTVKTWVWFSALALLHASACDGSPKVVRFSATMLDEQAAGPPVAWSDCHEVAEEVAGILSTRQARTLAAETEEVLRISNADDSLGGAIRTRYGLVRGNAKLVSSCSVQGDAVEASYRIILLTKAAILRSPP